MVFQVLRRLLPLLISLFILPFEKVLRLLPVARRRRMTTSTRWTPTANMSADRNEQGRHSKTSLVPWAPTSNGIQPRYTGPDPHEMTQEQALLRESIEKSRTTGLSGPFGPWLAIPKIALPAQELGRQVRYETTLTFRESELVILLTGAAFKSESEFDIHVGEARKAGLSWDVIDSIPRGRLISEEAANANDSPTRPEFSAENVRKLVIPKLEHDRYAEPGGSNDIIVSNAEREVAIALFTAELLEQNTVSDETYNETRRILGDQDSVLVEITSIVGYYSYVAYTLNVFKIPTSVKTRED